MFVVRVVVTIIGLKGFGLVVVVVTVEGWVGLFVGLPACIGAWLMFAPWQPRPFPALFPKGSTHNVAHRGGSGVGPENGRSPTSAS